MGENEEDRYKDVNKSENNDSINRQIYCIERLLDSIVYYSGQWIVNRVLNNILKLDLIFKFCIVLYLNICVFYIIGKILL